MFNLRFPLITVVALLSVAAAETETDGRKLLMAHYMPWYSSKPISGRWGWHWTMGYFDPDKISPDGRREIASHYYPIIGPYDSNDPDLLEYHTLLMKIAGIDGVIIDWYGIDDHYDYGEIHRNTKHLISYLKRAGLLFAICYEDQTIKHMVRDGVISADSAVKYGIDVMSWLHANWFQDDSYLKIDGRPVLLVFGPQYYDDSQWEEILASMPVRPRFYTLNRRKPFADGSFGWPPVEGSTTRESLRGYLDWILGTAQDADSVISVAFPGFHDIYAEAGVRDSYGHIPHGNGEMFDETLTRAIESRSRIIQLVTWNDYGEGTIIEPTVEFGDRYLRRIQEYRRKFGNFPYAAQDLALPKLLYERRKRATEDEKPRLDSVAALILSGRCREARDILTGSE